MSFLSAFHFITTFFLLEILCMIGVFERAIHYDTKSRWLLALYGTASVVFMNINLEKNSVGFYQLSKLCCIPALVLIDFFVNNKKTPLNVVLSLAILLVGVGFFTVYDVEFNIPGFIIAIFAVVSTTLFQNKTGTDQKLYKISGSQAQHASAFPQAVLAILSSIITEIPTKDSILKHKFVSFEVIIILVTGLLAVGVNIVYFALVGKTSAITYQVVGHTKTVLILIFGYIYFGAETDGARLKKNIIGVAISMVGIILYTYFKLSEMPQEVSEEREPLLRTRKSDNDV